MRIQHIRVRKLFGEFDHDIPLKMDDRITIIYGPNGFGKTFTLSLVNELFNPGFGDFFKVPFDEVAVTLENDCVVSVTKHEGRDGVTLAIRMTGANGGVETFSFHNREEKCSKEPSWLAALKEAVNIIFIHTERLIHTTDKDWRGMNSVIVKAAKNDGGKIELFERIVNRRFAQKRLDVDPVRGIEFVTPHGIRLKPEDLSSGEKHVFLLLYRLLFLVQPDSLILIDEPELSMHVFWQQEFLSDLDAILGEANVDILIATHSPQIIHDRWDLAVELKGPRG